MRFIFIIFSTIFADDQNCQLELTSDGINLTLGDGLSGETAKCNHNGKFEISMNANEIDGNGKVEFDGIIKEEISWFDCTGRQTRMIRREIGAKLTNFHFGTDCYLQAVSFGPKNCIPILKFRCLTL